MPSGLTTTWWVQALITTGLGLLGGMLIQYWIPMIQWVRYWITKLVHRPLELRGVFVFSPPTSGSGTVTDAYNAARHELPDVILSSAAPEKIVFSSGIYGFEMERFESGVHLVVAPRGFTSARADELTTRLSDVIGIMEKSGAAGEFLQGKLSVQLPHRPERISVGPKSGLRIVDYTIGLRRKNVNCDIELKPRGRYDLSSTNRDHLLDVVRRIR